MVLPVQQVLGVSGNPDAELEFGLTERDVGIDWVFPAEIEQALARSPGLRTNTHGLQVTQFVMAEVQRVGDPLFGELRRMASLVQAEAALLPVQASLEAGDGEPRVRLWTALVEIRTGRVLWFSILDGEPAPPGDPRGLASAIQVLTHALLWYVPADVRGGGA